MSTANDALIARSNEAVERLKQILDQNKKFNQLQTDYNDIFQMAVQWADVAEKVSEDLDECKAAAEKVLKDLEECKHRQLEGGAIHTRRASQSAATRPRRASQRVKGKRSHPSSHRSRTTR